MKHVEIRVFPIAKTAIDDQVVRKWLDDIGAVHAPWPQSEQNLTDAESVIGLSAKRCYMSFSTEDNLNPNVTRIRKEWTDYFDNILKSGHGSVCEHATYTFAIEGVSRVATGELNRHRAGVAISEGSMRYIRFTDIPYWIPTSIREGNQSIEYERRKRITREIFDDVFTFVQENYKRLVELWDLDDGQSSFHNKKQITSCLRRIIPMGVATGGVWTFNLRAMRHIIELRTSLAAEEEIFHVFGLIGKHMVEMEPRLFADFQQDKETGCYVPKYHKV